MAEEQDLVALTADIVSAHVANNNIPAGEVANLIGSVHQALAGLGAPAPAEEPAKPQGATTVRKSLANPGHIISMIDGKPYKMLRRHLGQHGHTPQSYREAFNLPRDYPMVAKDYAEKRRELAHKIGLGRKPSAASAAPAAAKPRAAKPAAVASAPIAGEADASGAQTEKSTRAASNARGRKPAADLAASPAKAPRRKLKPAFGDALAASKEHLKGE